jgi:hypothetical protein
MYTIYDYGHGSLHLCFCLGSIGVAFGGRQFVVAFSH